MGSAELATPPTDDYALLQQYLTGDASAMDRLVDRHAGRVYAFVLRFTGQPGHAEDLTQEVWLRVLRSARGFEGRARFTTWLFTVARSVCLDHYRRHQRRSERLPTAPEDELENLEHMSPLPLQRMAEQELAGHVLAAVSELPDAQREVFLLREQGLTFEEIASVQEASRDTVKSRMRYALTYVRRILRARLGEGANRGL
ncbi:MAG: sigma-70 family RNA polymerase sigma factor [Planctomycetes bacterium]|nr:sigma-70 family RNA polymerase sigma factor [Planctomycetota bacterium]